MNIDVDIRISNGDGEPEQCLVKHFSGRLDSYGNSIGMESLQSGYDKNFEDFLSEFLTNSGHMIRNNLLNAEEIITDSKNNDSNTIKKEELQYTFTLGTGQSITGRIPLKELNLIKMPEVIPSSAKKRSESFLMNEYFSKSSRSEQPELSSVGQVIGILMRKAIQKYEDNICYERLSEH